MGTVEKYTSHLGQYPVIFMALKLAKQPAFEMAAKNIAYQGRRISKC